MRLTLILLIFVLNIATGQLPSGADFSRVNSGRLYGKIVDDAGRGVGFATVQLYSKVFDFSSQSLKDTLWTGHITEENGDFELTNLPIIGELELVVSFIGYGEVRKKIDYGIKMPEGVPPMGAGRPAGPPQGNMPSMGNMPEMGGLNLDKDLGNIVLSTTSEELGEVIVVGKASTTALAIDRKTYRVDQDLTTSGGTAQDALKNVPSLTVDLDGNVSMRNSSPQIYIDGRPTTLSLNQIPANDIHQIEVLTNPSAKFDAGGGVGGIVNIILKKEKRIGYNGNIMAGVTSILGYNVGGDINLRQGKYNLFASAMLMQNKMESTSDILRLNHSDLFTNTIDQSSISTMNGNMANGRAGIDYFIDNRNTITLSGMYMQGSFNPFDDISSSTIYPNNTALNSSYMRTSLNERKIKNRGGSLLFKHLFPREGAEWTADMSFNQVMMDSKSDYNTRYDHSIENLEEQITIGNGSIFTAQSDFIHPVNESTKIEGGVKATLRSNKSENESSFLPFGSDEWINVNQAFDKFKFNDDVYAAYVQASYQKHAWGFQAGLRAESSTYKGALLDRDSSFNINYPINLFPSIFITRKIGGQGSVIQLAYTRRINRPGFFQTRPFIDYSDSLNISQGNPGLIPEFANNIELSYQNIFKNGSNLLVSLYYKMVSNLITAYQYKQTSNSGTEYIISSYANGTSASAFGAELTLKNSLDRWLDVTTNLNVYQSNVDATNIGNDLSLSQWSGFLKENIQINISRSLSLQINGEYRTRASFTPTTESNAFGPPQPNQNTAQGYTKSYWFADVSIRKSLFDQAADLTLSIQDVFASRKLGSVIDTDLYDQDSSRLMNPRLVRLNFSYRFGKMDTSLFRRKNNKVNNAGSDMMN